MARQRVEEGDEQLAKTIAWLHGDIKTPPFSAQARKEAGDLLRDLQNGKSLKFPQAEPLTKTVGPRCGALRVRDGKHSWRIMYRVDEKVVLVLEVYAKKTPKIPDEVIARCKKRLQNFDTAKAAQEKKEKHGGP